MLRRLVIVVLLLSLVLVWVPEAGEANPLTIVYTSMSPASQYVDVSPGATGSVLFSGECSADVYGLSQVIVNLAVNVTKGNATVSPQSFTLTSSQTSQALSISVVIPSETTREDLIRVRLNGTWTQGLDTSEVGPSEAQIIVLAYYLVDITCDNPSKEVKPGESADFDINVENDGNSWIEPRLQLINFRELNNSGISILFNDDFRVDIGESKDWTISIRTSESTPEGEYTIKLRIIYDDETNAVDLQFNLSVEKYPSAVSDPKIMMPVGGVVLAGIIVAVVYMRRKKG